MARVVPSIVCSACRSPVLVTELRAFESKPWGTVPTLSRRTLDVPQLIGSVYWCKVHGCAIAPVRISQVPREAVPQTPDPEEVPV